jgi:predicted deacylase
VLITGGVHGDEFEPMAAVRRLARLIEPARLRGRLTLVPVVNEPAFRLGSRTGPDGLDLARTCPGCQDGSVTQQIAWTLANLIRQADYYIDLHTGGTRLRVSPLVGYMLHPQPRVLAEQRRMARAFGLPIVWGTDCRLEGRSLSVARDAGVPAVYAEYAGGGGCDPAGIDAYVAGCLNVLRELGLYQPVEKRGLASSDAQNTAIRCDREVPVPLFSTRCYDLPAAPAVDSLVVEDDRPGSGHIQVNHPAASEGYFEPSVTLGQRIAAGGALGTISDVLGNQVETIHARHQGLVLVLHSFARVNAGEGVAVVLDDCRRGFLEDRRDAN